MDHKPFLLSLALALGAWGCGDDAAVVDSDAGADPTDTTADQGDADIPEDGLADLEMDSQVDPEVGDDLDLDQDGQDLAQDGPDGDLPPGEYSLTGGVVVGAGVATGGPYRVVSGISAGPAAMGSSTRFTVIPMLGGQ